MIERYVGLTVANRETQLLRLAGSGIRREPRAGEEPRPLLTAIAQRLLGPVTAPCAVLHEFPAGDDIAW